MKRNMKLIGLAACLISCTSLAVAQENPEPQERQQHEQRLPREVLNPEKIATQMTDQMQESLQLTEKQYKKIYKLNLKEQKEHFRVERLKFIGSSVKRPVISDICHVDGIVVNILGATVQELQENVMCVFILQLIGMEEKILEAEKQIDENGVIRERVEAI